VSRRGEATRSEEAQPAPEPDQADSTSPLMPEDDPLRLQLERERSELDRHPAIRIRTRIILSFLLVFALSAVITIWIIHTLSQIHAKIRFLEVADSYVSEIQQARRFEKNSLLYQTGIEDALDHVRNAQRLLDRNRDMVRTVIGAPNLDRLTRHAAEYQLSLNRMNTAEEAAERAGAEARLRLHGSQLIDLAMDFAARERKSVDRAFRMARPVPVAFLIVLLLTLSVVMFFLTRQFLGGLARFMEYTKRVGEGNFSPITDVRKYGDEFSQLALAFNHMIYELERRHRVLAESDKVRAIGSLVAGAAHELNNPLNNIVLTVSLLLEEFEDLDDTQKREMLADVVAQTGRSQRIVSDLLDFARKSETSIRRLDLERLVLDSARLVANRFRLAAVKLETEFEDDLPHVHGDEQLLKQVFVNLILNALDALPSGGRIRIVVRRDREEGYVAVEVRDNGPGIPPQARQRVFDPFFTTKTAGKGTGLGLSVSLGIVRKLGGFLRLESEEGEGTVFIVSLPVTASPADLMSRSDAQDGLGPLPTGLKRTDW
jgi:signal transduction histidine kinase